MKKVITTIVLATLLCSVKAQTFTWSGFSIIEDNSTDTVEIPVSGLQTSINNLFGIAHICINVTHTYKADLFFRLVSPTGTTVTLIDNTGGEENNFLGTCLGMDGTFFSNSQAPYTGLFQPVGNINNFNNGQDPNGTWLFIFSDQANGDTGSVHDVGLTFVHNPPGNPGGGGGPSGNINCPSCVCPGGVTDCDLLPDMTASAKEIIDHHNEVPGALYISNATPNIGYGPLDIFSVDSCFCGEINVPCNTVCGGDDDIQHVIKQRVYHKLPGVPQLTYYDRFAGTMTYHAEHGHIHVDHWANYTLRTATSDPDATKWPIVGTGVKQSFCLVNLGTCAGTPGECKDNNGNTVLTTPNNGIGIHTGCSLNQGIYPGSFDVYSISLNDPIPLVNVCNGLYYIVSITDPDNNFLESDEDNNWVAVPITLTQQNVSPVITAEGPTQFCVGGSVTLTSNIASNYLWSTGETTQSIVVNSTGSYTVSTNCGTSVATSAPVNVEAVVLDVTSSATPPSINCGGSLQLNSHAPSVGTLNIPVTFTSNQVVPIPDNNATGVTSTIVVSGISPASLNANSIVSVRINLTHTYCADLRISLIAPSGNTIILSNQRGGSENNFTNTVFSMSAATLIGNGSPPFTGTYKPDGNFANLGGNSNGQWKLKVQDLANVDVGNIENWNIILNNAVPETMSYSWSSSPPGFSSTLQNPTASPASNSTYVVTATSSATGCVGTESVAVVVSPFASLNSFVPAGGNPGSLIDIYGSGFSGVTGLTIAGNASTFSIIDNTHIQATTPTVPNTSGLICMTSSAGCTACSNSNFFINNNNPGEASLNLKLYIQGFYIGNGLMSATVDPVLYPTLCDSVTVKLHQPIPPYAEASSVKSTIDVSGNGAFVFPTGISGSSYYIAIYHRNSIQTWSKTPVLISDFTNYDFTVSSGAAFDDGFNLPMALVDINPPRWAIFNGDINRDGGVDGLDMTYEENASNSGAFGYLTEDITGDRSADSLDMTVIEDNSNDGIFETYP